MIFLISIIALVAFAPHTDNPSNSSDGLPQTCCTEQSCPPAQKGKKLQNKKLEKPTYNSITCTKAVEVYNTLGQVPCCLKFGSNEYPCTSSNELSLGFTNKELHAALVKLGIINESDKIITSRQTGVPCIFRRGVDQAAICSNDESFVFEGANPLLKEYRVVPIKKLDKSYIVYANAFKFGIFQEPCKAEHELKCDYDIKDLLVKLGLRGPNDSIPETSSYDSDFCFEKSAIFIENNKKNGLVQCDGIRDDFCPQDPYVETDCTNPLTYFSIMKKNGLVQCEAIDDDFHPQDLDVETDYTDPLTYFSIMTANMLLYNKTYLVYNKDLIELYKVQEILNTGLYLDTRYGKCIMYGYDNSARSIVNIDDANFAILDRMLMISTMLRRV